MAKRTLSVVRERPGQGSHVEEKIAEGAQTTSVQDDPGD
jgi:hypothetical protein